ncbi:FAT4 [Mytilus coruscus]|uniref:FAT4 n=1 Tax=Mytilus coruscus TaxID=42192 RepID=A0A6J8CZ02_MYTCO|nr:FAT4 [Mytilus coruscus]
MKVDGGWTAWFEWDTCSVTCGTGIQYRYRDCSDPLVYCDGANCTDCEGSLCNESIQRDTETNICNDFDCFICGNRYIGYGDPSMYTALDDSNTDYGILVESEFYLSTCCGVIKSWEFSTSNNGELHLMVWRNSGSTYTLTGMNTYVISSSAVGYTITYTVKESGRIPIQHGDMIGWYTPGIEVIPYNVSDPQNFRMTSNVVVAVGDTFGWSSVGYTNDRAYAIRIYTDNNSVPIFTNLNREKVIFDDQPAASNIYKVEFYDDDINGDLVWNVTASDTRISFNSITEYVYLVSTLDVATYTLTFELMDSCYNVVSGYLTVRVYNTPPRITSLPNFITLHEDILEGQLIHTLVVYDQQANDTITCVLTNSTPSSDKYSVELIAGTSDYGIYIQPNPSLDYNSIKTYQLFISCDDGKNDASSGYFFVHIEKNHPPLFMNLPASIDLDAHSTVLGDVIYTVQIFDDENNTVTFNMTTEPSDAPFEINQNGEIIATNNISLIFTPAYDLIVYVSDGKSTVGPRSLSVHVTDINDVLLISNLPLSEPFLVEENTAIGTKLYHVLVQDLNLNDTIQIYATSEPLIVSTYFNLTTDGFLTVSSTLDYESLTNTSYILNVTATDGKDTATATISLTITDQNEAPVFKQTQYSVEVNESAQNTAFPLVGFVIDDPDVSESFTYSLDCGNDTWGFSMSNDTGEIMYAYDYDLDTILVSQYNCTVKVIDSGSNIGTTNLIIDINDINDNIPYFNQTQYTFYITPYGAVGTNVGGVAAYDIDVKYGNITYSLNMTMFSKLFIQINNEGTLYINELLSSDFNYGDVMTFTVTAEDNGGLLTTVTVWIVFAETSTDLDSPTIPIAFLKDPKNILWLTALAILILAFAIGVCIFSTDFCKTKRRRPLPAKRPKTVKLFNQIAAKEAPKRTAELEDSTTAFSAMPHHKRSDLWNFWSTDGWSISSGDSLDNSENLTTSTESTNLSRNLIHSSNLSRNLKHSSNTGDATLYVNT